MKKLYAISKEEVNRLPFDYNSFGHVVFGQMTFIFALVVGIFFNLNFPDFNVGIFASVFTLGTAIVWEFFENDFLKKHFVDKRRDSLINSITDVILGMFGMSSISIQFLFSELSMNQFIITCVVFIVIFLSLYVIEYERYEKWNKK